ncbi:MAG: serine hydrolase [Planctomycetota bacterium]|jgi:CubicO group peptidase (beta-lactamase class C family)
MRVPLPDKKPSIALVALALTASAAPLAAAPPTAEQRLERLVNELEQRRVELHVPGMAVAVVSGDEVILSRGFGLADVDEQRPATDETLFAIGSTSKAITASLIGMLVDEGRMSWDASPRDYLPFFRLGDADADGQVTIRDLLSHRSGVATMTMLWYGNDVTSREVLEAYGRADLLYPFRERFNYSNVSYLAAGLAAAEAGGASWEALVTERLLGPLGMASSNTSLAEARSDPRMAVGYRWLQDDQTLRVHPMRDVSVVGPAGSINSSARDMAQWVRLQLRRGEHDGHRLLSEAQHAETWKRHVDIGDQEYGLGWFLRDWRGRRMVDHSGGIDGFTAKVAMLPDEDLGFVILTNLFATPLAEMAPTIVFDAMLGDWSDDGSAAPEEDVAALLGTYIGNFGQFRDAKFEVVVQNGRLAVDIPGQMVCELNQPDETGRRTLIVSDAIAVRFDRGDGDEARSLTIEQAGYSFELPREGVELPVEIDLEAARAYLGPYRSADEDRSTEIVIRNNRLAVDVPGQMVFELHPPDDSGRWVFRARDTIWLTFARDGDGRVESMTFNQDGQQRLMERMPTGGSDLPTADELMQRVHASHGAARLASLGPLRATGTVRLRHVGVTGTVETLLADGLRSRTVLDFDRFGRLRSACDGERGWTDNAFAGLEQVHGARLGQIRRSHPLLLLEDWTDHYEQVRVHGRQEADGREVYVVRLYPAEGASEELLVDVATGLVVELRQSPRSETGTRVEVRTRFEDYRSVGGVLIPFRTVASNDISGAMVVQLDAVEAGAELPPDAFTLAAR